MAKADVRIHDRGGHNSVPTLVFQTEGGETDINAGEPVKLKAAGSPYAIPVADAEPVIGTTTQILGIAASDSTHTASADGTVEVYMPLPGVVYAAKPKTATTWDTEAEVLAAANDRVIFDLTAGSYTIDVAAGDGATSGLQIVGGEAGGEVYFTLRPAATEGPIA